MGDDDWKMGGGRTAYPSETIRGGAVEREPWLKQDRHFVLIWPDERLACVCVCVVIVHGWCEELWEKSTDSSLRSDRGDLVPVLLVLTAVLAKVDGSHFQDAECGTLSIAAQRRGAPPVLGLGALDDGLRLLCLGVRGRGDRVKREKVEKSSAGARHFDGGFGICVWDI